MKKKNLNIIFIIFLSIATALTLGVTLHFKLSSTSSDSSEVKIEAEIRYAAEQIPATLDETGLGGTDTIISSEEIPTVESIESTSPSTFDEDSECEAEECGRGAIYPTLDISSPQAFKNEILGKCIDVDGYYGSQCWDAMAAYFFNYVGRTLSTCGTGAAKGTIADGCWQKNAGDEFTMIWNPEDIQPGDIAVYSSGTWGHIGMAMGSFNNGYFTLLGQNQGGNVCPGGGAAGNIINLSTKDFIGAFRPNIYIIPEPEPEAPADNKCKSRTVKHGDTLGQIMQECLGKIEWGEAMNDYAKHWYSTKYHLYLTVYDGWASQGGYGLFSDDVIEWR